MGSSLYKLCISQIFSLAAFSHAEYTPQPVALGIHQRIRPYPTVRLSKSSYFLAKFKRLNLAAVIRRGLGAGLCDFKPNPLLRHCEMVIRITFVHCQAKLQVSFCTKLMENMWLCISSCSHLWYLFSLDVHFFPCR